MFIKTDHRYCENYYRTEKTLDNAMESCINDEKCKFFFNEPCNDEGPFKMCQNQSELQISEFDICAYAKKEAAKLEKRISVPNFEACDWGLKNI